MSILIPKIIPKEKFDLLKVKCPPTDNISTASFAVVSDSPSNIEVLEQEPFLGPSGNQFKRICSAAKIPMYQIYQTFAVKCPVNNMNKVYTSKGYRHPSWGELQENLINELSEFNGSIIILLGELPMRLLLDEPKYSSIEKYRGSIYLADDFPHLKEKLKGKLIALTYHPSFTLLRNNPISFYTLLFDMKKFINVDNNPELLRTPVSLYTRPSFNDVMNFYSQCLEKTTLAFDIESTPKYITCFSLAFENPDKSLESMSIPLMDNKGNYWTVEEEIKIWDRLATILSDTSIRKICQNGMFDIMFVLRTMNIVTDNFFFDTMLAQHIVYTDLPKGLDYLTSVYTYFPYYKDEGKQAHLAVIKDWDMYWNYNAKDSAYLLPITTALQEELTLFEANDVMKYTMNLHKPLMEMEWNGILTEREGIEKARKSYNRKIHAMQHGLNKIAGKDLNINSSKQMIAYFYGICMIKPYVQRSGKYKGNPTCNAVALSRIARKKVKGSIEAKMIIKIRTYYKLVSTYFNINVDADNKLRCSHKISGTAYGRIATEKTFFGTGANLQNQPYEYKKYLIPDPEHILCEVDLAKAEAHVVGYLAQDENMIQIFSSGIDSHSFNASKIFNVPIEEVIKEAHEKKADQKKTMRYMGKKVAHASNYGMGGQTFSDNLAKENIFMTKGECDRLLKAYNNSFPGLDRWHKLIETEVMNNRMLYNLFNRPVRFLGVMNASLFRSAYSYKPQSTVAELLNRGTIKMCNDSRLNRNHYDIDFLTTVHDSDVFQFKIANIPNLLDILLIIKEHLTHTFIYKGKLFTIGLDAKIGFQWAGEKVAEIGEFTKENIETALHKIGVK